jgi:hypothetical protein
VVGVLIVVEELELMASLVLVVELEVLVERSNYMPAIKTRDRTG